MKAVLGIDVGGTNIRMGVLDKEYNIYNFKAMKTEELLNDSIEKFAKHVNDFILEQNEYEIELISIGFPSTINKDRTLIYSTPNIKPLQNINVAGAFKKYCEIPIIIEKDVNLLLKYDIFKNNLTSQGIILGFYIGTGLGNSIMLDGKFLTGQHGVAGELGHIPTLQNHDKCGCGNIGCIENIASGKYIANITKKYKNLNINDFFSATVTAKEVDSILENLAVPLATEINIFDPQCVFIGGGVIEMKKFPKEKFLKKIIEHLRKPYPANDINIIFAEGKQIAGVIGAGIYGYERLGGV